MRRSFLAVRGVARTRTTIRASASSRPCFPQRQAVGFASTVRLTQAQAATLVIVDGGISMTPSNGKATKRQTLPAFWLRDNCRCSSCVNQDTAQRNFNTFSIPADISPTKVEQDENGIEVTWPDGHRSEYPWSFLRHYQNFDHRENEPVRLRYWGAEASENPPSVAYEKVMLPDDSGVAELTNKIREHGFAFVHDTPYEDPDVTRRLLERIAFIRLTHYGGFYDFIPDLAMADTAYTNIALPAHTDTTYFTDPAGLQSFHLLSHRGPPGEEKSSGPASGGKSLLVDGFHAANLLREREPRAFDILRSVRLPWHASGNKGITIAPDRRYPVLEVDETTGELHRVRWNNDDRGVVPFGELYSPEEWYDAARKWDAILRSPELECWIQLQPGKPLIFDNWRVLHGRSAFTGIRRICGAYINRDDFISRWRNTNFPRQEILDRIVG
ncbi:hypothetical protein VTK73DRAFT_9254 [Phialemonium thermophilum]|uniref:trimethyllysine dioxygenase n=1 Tax=Phialemonium thermophilum TaxID=223376 RepID=A0ABR3XLF9_9PEZI